MSQEKITPAPNALIRTVHAEANKTYEGTHDRTMEKVTALITPLLEALSVPEVISRSTTLVNGAPAEDLYRRILDYPAVFEFEEKKYGVDIMQVLDKDGKTRHISFNTGINHDTIPLATMGPNPKRMNYIFVRNARGDIANKEELEEIESLAELLTTEAPRQAVEKGRISPHWMERHSLTSGLSMNGNTEGFPKDTIDLDRRPKVYEIIRGNGQKLVARPDTEKGVWIEDVNEVLTLPEDKVAAWRELKTILPDYYRREKYPNLYKD